VPTTAPWIVEDFLTNLASEGVAFAVLHGESDIATAASDVDIVGEMPAGDLLRVGRRTGDYAAIMLWPYERSGSASLFLATPDLSAGAQIDVMYDPDGRGRLGLKSARLLEHTVAGTRFPTLEPAAQLVYLLRKRIVKGQADELDRLVGVARRQRARITQIAAAIGRPAALASIEAAIAGARPRNEVAVPFSARHLAKRILRPVGAWIHWDGPSRQEVAEEFDRRVGRILPHRGLGPLPASATERTLFWLRRIQPVRMRAGVFTTWGDLTGPPHPDHVLTLPEIPPAVDFLRLRLGLQSQS
jgi:hypothetical protein